VVETHPMSGDTTAPLYLPTDQRAAQLGITPHALRALAAAGMVPGAVRVSGTRGPWRFLASAPAPGTNTPRDADALRGGSADSGDGAGAQVMSSQRAAVDDTLALALEIRDHLSVVTTRPALALAALVVTVAGAAVRHTADADGRCMSCRWPTYPCPDARRLTDAVRDAHATVVDGAR
jgi:hypothetical protein